MSCETCLITKPIPMCALSIILGEITDVNTSVIVKIKNESTQRIEQIPATSDGSGIVTVNTSTLEFMESHYTFSIHPVDDYSNDYDISIEGEQAKCVDVSFEHCNESLDEVELEMAE